MGRRTAEYAFSVVSVCSVVNALDAPRYRRGMTGGGAPKGVRHGRASDPAIHVDFRVEHGHDDLRITARELNVWITAAPSPGRPFAF